jgi:transcriptional regulator with XRE-family HTH domain
MAIGQLLKKLREDKGLTQQELERLSSVSQAVISRIEKSNGIPRFDTVCMISDGLGISPKEIWDRIKNELIKDTTTDRVDKIVDNQFDQKKRRIQRGDG